MSIEHTWISEAAIKAEWDTNQQGLNTTAHCANGDSGSHVFHINTKRVASLGSLIISHTDFNRVKSVVLIDMTAGDGSVSAVGRAWRAEGTFGHGAGFCGGAISPIDRGAMR